MRCGLLESQIYIATTGQYRLCCVSSEEPNTETVWTHTPEQWKSSDTVQTAIEQLKNDQWPSACIKCKTQEVAGLESKRTKQTDYGPGITHVDLRFGNNCNLQCISCNPRSSSSINQETLEMSKAGIIPIHSALEKDETSWYDEKFFNYFENYPLKEIYLTGGEPMMVKHLPEFLDRLDTSIHLRFNTNATIFNPKLFKILKKFNKVTMSASIDAIGKKIEYIRYGSKWQVIEENLKIYFDNFETDLSPTISVLNAAYYDEIKEYADNKNIKVYENLLMGPNWLHVKNAPESLKLQFKYVDAWMNQPADPGAQQEFVRIIKVLDSFRQVSINDYLPEVAKAYGLS